MRRGSQVRRRAEDLALRACLGLSLALGRVGCGGSEEPAPPENGSADAAQPEQAAEPDAEVETEASAPLVAGPRLVVDAPERDFGTVAVRRPLRHAFTLRNAGDEAIEIERTTSSCGCAVAAPGATTVPPGGTVELPVELTPVDEGSNTAVIAVFTNDPESPRTDLRVRAERIVLAFADPRTLDFGEVAAGSATTLVTTVYSPDPTFEIQRITIDHPDADFVRWSLLPSAGPVEDAEYPGQLDVEFQIARGMPAGPFNFLARIDTLAAAPPDGRFQLAEAEVRVRGQVQGDVHAPARAIVLQAADGGGYEGRTRLVSRTGRAFAVTRAEIVTLEPGGDFEVTPAPFETGGFRGQWLVERGTPEPADAARFYGVVEVLTDSNNDGPLRIEFAFVRR